MASQAASLVRAFPWTKSPLIVSGPMRTVSGVDLATAVSKSGGIGFYGPGYDVTPVSSSLAHARTLFGLTPTQTLPIGIGFILWKTPLEPVLDALRTYRPAAIWLFAPLNDEQMCMWIAQVRKTVPGVSIWAQVGSVPDARVVLEAGVDVLVLQGGDAGGHGIAEPRGSIFQLVPEVLNLLNTLNIDIPVLAAGGIVDGRGVAAALALGAHGVVMGTRFIASVESAAPEGFKQALLRATDGGSGTIRTRLYDDLRGTGGWPAQYDGRVIVNESWRDHVQGLDTRTNKELYEGAVEKGDWSRLTMFAGTGVGLVGKVLPAGDIVEEVRREASAVIVELGRGHTRL